MPPQLIIALLVIAALAIFLNSFLKASPAHVAKKIKQVGFYVAISLVIIIAIVKLNWIVAAIGALFAALPRLLPLLRYLPVLKWFQNWQKGRGGFDKSQQSTHSAASNNKSKVSARYIIMTLNHESGELDGEISEGRFAGQRLSAMSKETIIQFYEECLANDDESAALVETYLDRIYNGSWRNTEKWSEHSSEQINTDMTKAEALDILGLDDGASTEDIIQAHRRLMQKMHPDRGGSDYLAAKINQAKELLL